MDQLITIQDLQDKYCNPEKIVSLTALDFEYTQISKLRQICDLPQDFAEQKIAQLQKARKNIVSNQDKNYDEMLKQSLDYNKSLLEELRNTDFNSFEVKNKQAVFEYFKNLLKARITHISDELCLKKESLTSNNDEEQQDDDFSESAKRSVSTGSVIQEQFDMSNLKSILKKRLINYKQAIDYCHQISQTDKVIQELIEKAEIIKKFIDTYDSRSTDEHLEIVFKLPRDVTPQDVLGRDERSNYIEFQKHIRYIEKLIPQIQKARVKHMNIFKKQKDPISKENFQKLTKMVESQEEVKSQLMSLVGNRWQPLPEFYISDESITSSEDKQDFTTLQIEVNLPLSYKRTFFSYYFTIRLKRGHETIDTHEVQIAGQNCSTSFSLDKEEVFKINQIKVEIELSQWRFKIFDIILEDIEISLMSLMKSNSFKRSASWDEERFGFVFSILDQEQQRDEVFKLMNVITVPDPFKINESAKRAKIVEEEKEVQKDVNMNKVREKVKKPAPQAKEKPKAQPTKKVNKVVQKPKVETVQVKTDVPIPSELKSDEIEDPDIQRNLYSVLYCTKRLEQVDSEVKSCQKAGKMISKYLKSKLLLFTSQKNGLTSAIENEQVTFEQYMGYLNKSLKHDTVLLKYLQEVGKVKQAQLVKMRIECTKQEIEGDPEDDSDDE